jgi:hypothetical protein
MTSAKSSATDDSKDEYIMGTNDLELHRISMQHAILKDYMGTLTLAPVDFTQPGLKILDVCTANGSSKYATEVFFVILLESP